MSIDKETAAKLLYQMMRIRGIEEEIATRYSQGKMRCPTHLSIGQEAVAVGVGSALLKSDLATSTHRAHAHYLAKGGDAKAMVAEIYGKATGCSRGRGGSMHLTDRANGFIGSTAIVGNTMPIGVGLGLNLQLNNSSAVSAVFFGDGSIEEGVFYESINFAIVRKLPVLFVCENNFYSVYSPMSVRQPADRRIYEMVRALGAETVLLDGNNVEEVFNNTTKVLDYIREGNGPFFMELVTYRWLEHCGPNYDNNIGYRTEEEFLEWKIKDPIFTYQNLLKHRGWIDNTNIEKFTNEIAIEVSSTFEFAENSPYPNSAEAFSGLYA